MSSHNPKTPTSELPKVAVIAHSGKTLGGGLTELRQVLADSGFPEPLWLEVAKSKYAPAMARKAMAAGVDIVFVWGGDGSVQKCVDVLAKEDVLLAILPAGTGNLLARNLNIPQDIKAAVEIGLHGDRRSIDTGTINGEHFSIMAGAGMDALTMEDADKGLKDRFGRAAYLWTGARQLAATPIRCRVWVEGRKFYKGKVTCVLIGNLSQIMGSIEVFEGSRPDDGILEIGVMSAKSRTQWLRTISRVVVGRAENSPFIDTTRGTRFKVRFDHKVVYELDGSVRKPTKQLDIRIHPKSITICVPFETSEKQTNR
ncbi:MAG: diacylglycerol kinase family protein [Actinomycetota bacterium]|nr:diacylglycerol kinase family protein [Actinomycetota bacterium]